MRISRFRSYIDHYIDKYNLEEVDIRLESGIPYAGYCETNSEGVCKIRYSVEFIRLNSSSICNELLLHEIAHLIDYKIHGGWRVRDNEILYHDTIFYNICKFLGCSSVDNILQFRGVKTFRGIS